MLAWNSNSIVNRLPEFRDYVAEEKFDVVLLCETFLKPANTLSVPNYHIYRSDRLTGRNGGVAVLVKKNIHHERIPNFNIVNLEHAAVNILMSDNRPITIIAAYNSPSKPLLASDLSQIFPSSDRIILGGDLNAKNRLWNSRTTTTRGRTLAAHAASNNYSVVGPDQPTHYGTGRPDVLDVFLLNNIEYSSTVHTQTVLSSDHNPIILDWHDIPVQHSEKQINWRKFTDLLKNTQPLEEPKTVMEINSATRRLTVDIQAAISEATKIKIKNSPDKNSLPPEIKQLIQLKNRALRKAQRTLDPRDKREANRLTNKVKYEIQKFKNDSWQEFLETINEDCNDSNAHYKPMWNLNKRLKNKSNRSPPLHGPGRIIHTDHEKADVFADRLQLQFSPNRSPDDDIDFEESIERKARRIIRQQSDATIRSTNAEEVLEEIKYLKKRSSPGEDGITNSHLKNCPIEFTKNIVNLINGILRLQHFPEAWKNAIVILIPKQGEDPLFPQSHRPISLLCTMGKLTERIVLRRLEEELQSNNTIPDEQYGFRAEHSTEQQVLRLTENVINNINMRHISAAAFFDISKAFDKVWHQGLIVKMNQAGTTLAVTRLINSYLKSRTFQVKIGSCRSAKTPITAGVPQGGVLSPKLYNIYSSDIPRVFGNAKIFTYADDTAVLAHSRNLNLGRRYLQSATDSILEWMEKWKIKVNPKKTQAIVFSRKAALPSDQLEINGEEIPWSNKVKYLGVIFDRKLTWKDHIEEIKRKTTLKNIQLHPLMARKSKLSLDNKLRLYKMVIVPSILYCSTAWGQAAKCHKSKLEVIQSKTLRKITDAPWFIRNNDIRKDLKIDTVSKQIRRRNKKLLEKFESHTNPTLAEALNYDPEESSKIKRPKLALNEEGDHSQFHH